MTADTAPRSDEAEWALVSAMLTHPDAIAEVIGAQTELEDFYRPDTRLIFEAAAQAHYGGQRVDAVTVGARLASPLAAQWSVQPAEVAGELQRQALSRMSMRSVQDHLQVVKAMAEKRRLVNAMAMAQAAIREGQMTPAEIGDLLATEVSSIIAGSKRRSEILSFYEVGRQYVGYLKRLKIATESGVELAVKTGFKFVDYWIKGLAPTELMFLGGEPGVGKSMVAWKMAEGFARRQLLKPEDRRVGTLVLSLEMGLVGSSARLASSLTRVEGDRLREGIVTDADLSAIIKAWKGEKDLPLYWNFASSFKFSQLRALVVEAIRRHNVGFIVIDHFRMFDPDRRINNVNQEEEAKARFLKEELAKDLNVAVLCLAHTVKLRREENAGRPQLADLRGSGQVTAHPDVVAFVYSPYMYATEEEKINRIVLPTEMEMIFRKNRNGALGTSEFYSEPATMTVRDQW